MLYKLEDGTRIRTFRASGEVEFVTENSAREVISTVRLGEVDAAPLVRRLTALDGLRFLRQVA